MILKHQDGLFYTISQYSEKDIPKSAGFRWNPAAKRWETREINRAVALIRFADDQTRTILQKPLTESRASELSTESSVEIPVPAGCELLPFQKAGVAYALTHPKCLIADEMGVGKTIQAISVVNVDESIKKVLIVVPASLKINWARECSKWLTRSQKVEIVSTKTGWPEADIFVINYDILSKFPQVHETAWDMMILDESHYLKNPKTSRTKEVFGYKDAPAIRARRILALTGTPILNRPIELWPVLRAFGAMTSWKYYVERYCGAYQSRWGWNVSGASNLDELQLKLRASCMIRRTKSQVLSELPAKRRQIITLQTNGNTRAVLAEQRAQREQGEKAAKIAERLIASAASEKQADYESAVAELGAAEQVAFTEMSKIRHETALAKVPDVVEFVRDALESEFKIVVFAHHLDVIAALMEGLAEFSPVSLTGEMSLEDRQKSVDSFQTDEKTRVFIGNIKAAGVGITLTAASHVVFAELDWTPALMTQAEDRTHRIGQPNSVLVQHLVLEGSIDARMAEELVSKQNVIDAALDRQAMLPPAPVEEEMPKVVNTYHKVEDRVYSDAEINELLSALRTLAESDGDHAKERNGFGFNKFDSAIGHKLAALDTLSQKQADLASRLLHKYTKQLGSDVAGDKYNL